MPPWAGAVTGLGAGLVLWAGTAIGSPFALAGFAVLGWLYALCQHRTNWLGYLLVGLSYGITVWIVTQLGCKLHAFENWPLVVDNRGSLLRCILFAEMVALGGLITAGLRRPTGPIAVAKD